MQLWIDIEDASGNRLGAGPLTRVLAWLHTPRLSAAGEFVFTVPAADPRCDLLRAERKVRCWGYAAAGGLVSLGAGTIKRIQLTVNARGAPILEVSGPDLLGELNNRRCLGVSLLSLTTFQEHPTRVWVYYGDTYIQGLSAAIDYQVGDTTTYGTVTMDPDYHIELGYPKPFNEIRCILGAKNTIAGTIKLQYFNGSNWHLLYPTDGTNAWHQDGSITFAIPTDWVPTMINYEVHLYFYNGTSAVQVYDISVLGPTLSNDAIADVLAYAPDGWSLDAAHGYTEVQWNPLGPELLANPGLELFSGTVDDTDSDTPNDWLIANIDDPAGASALATSDSHSGSIGFKLSTSTVISSPAALRQMVTVVGGNNYELAFWTHGDGSGQLAYLLQDVTHGYDELNAITDCGVTGAGWERIVFDFTAPVGCTQIRLSLYSPYQTETAAWVDDVSIKQSGWQAVNLQLQAETVLETLRRVAAMVHENFILSPTGRRVLWLGADVRSSGLRAIGGADPIAVENNDDVVLIQSFVEIQDAYDVISRLYPYGGGMGTERLTLAGYNAPVPDGYVVNTTENYIERTAAVTVLGRIEGTQQWSDIVCASTPPTAAEQIMAANALLYQAWDYLESHSCTSTERLLTDPDAVPVPRFYQLKIAKLARVLLPGSTIRVVYHEWVDGYHSVGIDRDLWITGATHEVTTEGIYTVGLEVSTVPRLAESDDQVLARNLMRVANTIAHNIAQGC